MPVVSPQVNDTRCIFADWLELVALTSSRRSASRADVVRLVAKQNDRDHGLEYDSDTGEDLETEILESDPSSLADNVADELDFRAKTLETSYPFTLKVRKESWSLVLDPVLIESQACQVYIFCLLISVLRNGRLFKEPIKSETKVDFTSVFQDISFLAATQLMGNGGMSFGYPRPDGSRFLDAINQFAKSFGVGEARTQFLPASLHREKDEGIDVLAWRSFADKRPGQILLLGQVASGNDWHEKPVQQAVDTFFDWFSTHPSKFYLPAIFIPFVQHHDFEPLKSQAYGKAVLDYCRRKEMVFGLVIDRLRIVELIASTPMPNLAKSLENVIVWSEIALQYAARAV